MEPAPHQVPRSHFRAYAAQHFRPDDAEAQETTGSSMWNIDDVIPLVSKVVLANAPKVRQIAISSPKP